MPFQIIINEKLCFGCSTCINFCPINQRIEPDLVLGCSPKTNDVIFKLINGKSRVINQILCEKKEFPCNVCVEMCPKKAITIIHD
ncbi:MAG: 4Fe-4S binding protein [Candidatus Helarchaeota archaeon]